jgi:hypothetical protein
MINLVANLGSKLIPSSKLLGGATDLKALAVLAEHWVCRPDRRATAWLKEAAGYARCGVTTVELQRSSPM